MSELTSVTSGSSDAELIAAVRSGDLDAYGDLFGRHHEAAMRLARQLVRGPDADDLVAEGFVRVMAVLQAGKGPDEFFRAYLLSSIRRLHIDRIRATQRVRTTDDENELDRAIEFVDPAEMKFEQQAAATAFASLPERWQLVLWHLDVEGQKPAQIATLLGMSPNSVSALAYRAREGLRLAYLQGHLAPPLDDSCDWTTSRLGQHVRKALSKRESKAVDEHLDTCSRCTALYLELVEVNSHLAGLLAPAVLGAAAAGYLGSGSAAAATGGLGAAVDWLTKPFKAAANAGPVGATVAAAAAITIVAAVAVSQVVAAGDEPRASVAAPTRVDQPTQSAPGPDGGDTPAKPTPTPRPTVTTIAPVPPFTPAPTHDAPAPKPSTRPTRPEPSTPPTTPALPSTDYGVAIAFVDEAPQFQRRVTIDVPAVGDDPDKAALTVTLQLVANSGGDVEFRGGLTAEWTCGPLTDNQPITTLTCTREQTGLTVPPLAFSVHGLNPQVTATVGAADNVDGDPANNTAVVAAPDWQPA